MKKYELLENDFIQLPDRKLYRIRALKTFGSVEKGDIGGYIETEDNLLHQGNAWIYGKARVYDNARVYGNAGIYDNARVHGNAWVYGNAEIYDNAEIYGNAQVYDNAEICDNAQVYDNAEIYDDAWVYDNAWVYGKVEIYGDAEIYDNARVYGNAEIQNGHINHRMVVNSKFEDVKFFAFTKARDITALKVNGEWLFNIGCQNLITKEVFLTRIKSDGGVEAHPHRQDYLDILKLF